jgi:peroxiredoxin Q/BCP
VAYFMVSLDDPEKNRAFAESVEAGFVLLSDPGKQNAERFGVLALGGLYARRWTFFIDRDGIVRRIDKNVSPASHGEDVVGALGELGFPKRRDSAPQPDN